MKRLKFTKEEGTIYRAVIDAIEDPVSHRAAGEYAEKIMTLVQDYGERRFKAGRTFESRRSGK
jgi:hypothetical protein